MQKFIVNSTTLLNALQYAGKAVEKNGRIPIIESYLFQIENKILTVIGADLQTTFKVSFRIESNQDVNFSAVVPPDITKYLTKIEEQPLTFCYNEETYSIELLEMDAVAKYSGDNPQDFPMHPQTDIHFLDITSCFFKEFKDLLNYVSGDELRPAMTGIAFMSHENDLLTINATDGHRLKSVETAINTQELPMWRNDEGNQFFILPAKPAKILASLKFGTDKKPIVTDVSMHTNEGNANIGFKFHLAGYDMELICRSIDERFPQYWSVIPSVESTKTVYQVDKSKLNKSIDKALLFADKTTKMLILSLNGSNTLNAEDIDFANKYSAEIGGSYSGEPIKIGFNGDMLKETINSFPDSFKLDLIAPNKAAVIREGNATVLLMPVMITAE